MKNVYAINPVINNNYKVPVMELGQKVKIRCPNNDNRHKRFITFEGNIIFANNRCITVKGKNYPLSFTIAQFKIGEVKLLI